jgi:septation ring formation regulator EzrA
MSDTLIIGIITGTVALLSVGLNIFWMSKTFDQLSASVKDLGARMDKQFDRVDKQFDRVDKQFERIDRRFEAIDRRFEGIEGDLKQFYKLHTEHAAALQTLRDRNPDLK